VALLIHYDHGPLLGVLVAASLFINHAVACVWGATIPFLMRAMGFDPAQSATIFTTTLTDMVGFFTLLGLAAAALKYLP
jgi:magnesium transporter